MSIYFYYFPIISPLGRAWPFIWTNLNPLHPGILCAKVGWIWPSGSGEEDENVKVYRQTDRRTDRQTTDDRWSEKLTWAFSSGELKRKQKRISEASICEWILISNYTSGDKWFWDFAQYIIYMKQPLYLAIIPLTPDINV